MVFVLIHAIYLNYITQSVFIVINLQIGGEVTDFIIVLHDFKAVKTFCSRMHFSLGAGLSAAAGPVGRALEADLRAGSGGSGMCYTYSCSKGKIIYYACYAFLYDHLQTPNIDPLPCADTSCKSLFFFFSK